MPVLQLQVSPLLNPPQYAALGQTLTELTARVLRKRAEVTAVLIDDLPAARFLINGQISSLTAACLKIYITAGTNTAVEKSEFIAQAYDLLTQLLGELHPASYVIIQELPATDWGYAGLTQSARKTIKEVVANSNV
jgi:4-oxalocrotonate tautomerase